MYATKYKHVILEQGTCNSRLKQRTQINFIVCDKETFLKSFIKSKEQINICPIHFKTTLFFNLKKSLTNPNPLNQSQSNHEHYYHQPDIPISYMESRILSQNLGNLELTPLRVTRRGVKYHVRIYTFTNENKKRKRL